MGRLSLLFIVGFFTIVKYCMLEIIHPTLDIWKRNLNLSNDEISYIYQLKEKDPVGYKKSNYGGWHSRSFVYTKQYNRRDYSWIIPTMQIIEKEVNESLSHYISRSWFNINSTGNSNNWHHHGLHPIVGVFYIQVPENSGNIEFQKNEENFSYFPINGDFLLFPGNLNHRVLENKSTEDRISLAINFSA
jgi:hypothetical protein